MNFSKDIIRLLFTVFFTVTNQLNYLQLNNYLIDLSTDSLNKEILELFERSQ